ncbi:hypothetical protein SKAU_G00005980 [Synaphobranchus kaupii]|uniref:Uncharacterized protein n=1 Tax=Synaphobranchus kaupii TaxID=118154 RepID=A0A9Q1G933_SYNKA|nr:hypothetical protein SKAU_G00005980 [Synaphobranchus kaupii]
MLQLEAEKEKGARREESIAMLRADKAYHQEEFTKKEEFIRELIQKDKETPDYPQPPGCSGNEAVADPLISLSMGLTPVGSPA